MGFDGVCRSKHCAKQSMCVLLRGREKCCKFGYYRRHGLDGLLCQSQAGILSFVLQPKNIQNDRPVKRIFIWSKSNGMCWEKMFLKFIHGIWLSHLFEQETVCVANTI